MLRHPRPREGAKEALDRAAIFRADLLVGRGATVSISRKTSTSTKCFVEYRVRRGVTHKPGAGEVLEEDIIGSRGGSSGGSGGQVRPFYGGGIPGYSGLLQTGTGQINECSGDLTDKLGVAENEERQGVSTHENEEK
jgi:hypothetical protein